jgi:mono/diheme cytochrome c family protein
MRISRHGVTVGSVFLIWLPILAVALPDKKQLSVKRQATALGKAPAEAAARQNPYETVADAVAAGKKLFRRHCEECHGREAAGSTAAPSLRSGAVRSAAPGALYWFVTNGDLRHGMPSWSGLPTQQRWQLVRYLKSLEVTDKTSGSRRGGTGL